MANKIFVTLLERKIDNLKKVFLDDSENIYKDDSGSLFHPGEFGMFRERVIKKLVETILPINYGISDGFIITSKDNRSTQCDLIIYDKNKTPIINDGIANFFPIESVIAIIEVKSIIKSNEEFENILKKLSNIKKLDADIAHGVVCEKNQISTLLICRKFKFSIKDIKENCFDNIYGNIEKKYRHNMILSLEQGNFSYTIINDRFKSYNKEKYRLMFGSQKLPLYPYPVMHVFDDEKLFDIITNAEENNIHIKMFLRSVFQIIKNSERPNLELQEYYLE